MIYIRATYICNEYTKSLYHNINFPKEGNYTATINHECLDYIEYMDCPIEMNEYYDIIEEFDEPLEFNIFLNTDTLPEGLFKYVISLFCIDYISENIDTIPKYFCNQCRNLQYINIPNSVTTIDKYSFCGSGLTSLDLSHLDHILIKESAFSNSRYLETLTLPQSYDLLSYAFAENFNLKTINGQNTQDFVNEFERMEPELMENHYSVFLYCNYNVQLNGLDYFVPDFKEEGDLNTLKCIITQNNKLRMLPYLRHFMIVRPNNILIFGGGKCELVDQTKLMCYGVSDGFGEMDWAKLNYDSIPHNIHEIYYENELIWTKPNKKVEE